MATKKTSIELTTVGGDKVKIDFDQIGEKAQRALTRISESATPANSALKILDATAHELREGIGGLAEESGVFGRIAGAVGPIGLLSGGLADAAFGFVELTHRAVENAAALSESAGRVGLHVGQLQELRFA